MPETIASHTTNLSSLDESLLLQTTAFDEPRHRIAKQISVLVAAKPTLLSQPRIQAPLGTASRTSSLSYGDLVPINMTISPGVIPFAVNR